MTAPEVIFAPDLIGAALVDKHARRCLELWRDGAIKSVCNRQLLLAHLKTLREFGLSSVLIKRWTWWLTANEKSNYLADLVLPEAPLPKLCESLAEVAKTPRILCWKKPASESKRWIAAADFHP